MKRTLAISLLLGIAAVAVAQTPASTTPAKTVTVTQKPAPGTKVDASKVKVAAVPTAKPTVKPTVTASKPTVVAVKPSKPAVVAAKPAVVAAHPQSAKPVIVAKPMPPAAKPKAGAVVAATPVPHKADAPKRQVIAVQPRPKNAKVAVVPLANKPAGKAPVAKNSVKVPNAVKPAGTTVAVNDKPQDNEKKPEPRKTGAAGRRDPFVSPVVAMGVTGSGCSTGKRCLAIDAIALRGIVKSDTGMIAVVVNAMDKAYFLRENDPVFNGYVVKITGDSIVFKETFHDKLGKELTRDVTKSISRPAA